MKKIFTLFALLVLTVTGAQAQVYETKTGQDYISKDEVISKANNGTLLIAIQNQSSSSQNYLNSTACVQASFDASGTTVWEVVPYNNNFVLKNVSTGTYIGNAARPVTFTSDIESATQFMPQAVTGYDNPGQGNIASGFVGNDGMRWAVAPDCTSWFIANGATATQTVLFGGGTGNWSIWFAYEVTLKYNLVYKCYNTGESEPFQTVTSTDAYADGETVTITESMLPEVIGKSVGSYDTEVTINGANAEVNVYYNASTTFNYTLVVNGAPDGTTVTIKGETVSAGPVSFSSEVTQSDVAVSGLPANYGFAVTISGTTITVSCAYTQTVITNASEISNNKLYTVETQGRGAWTMNSAGTALRSTGASGVSTSATQWAFVNYESNTYLYNVEKKTFILKNGEEASAEATHGTPVTLIKYTSEQMDGWGASYDGFQASQHYFAAQMGTAEINSTTLPAYINFGGSKNTLVNGWGPGNAPDWDAKCGADAGNALRITEAGNFDPQEALTALDNYFHPQYTINYVVKDENGATLFTANDVPATAQQHITVLPEEYQRSAFYTYNTVDVTINQTVTDIEFTATWKADAPFVQSTSYADATWYYAKIRDTKWLRADENAKDGSGRYQTNSTNEETDVYKWAFIGNPYDNFFVANMGHGDGKYLYASDTTAPTMTAVSDPANTDAAKWEVIVNGNGFTLRSLTGANLYINDNANGGNIGYWDSTNGRTDGGGKWTLTKILTDDEKYQELIALLEEYPFGTNVNQYSLTIDEVDQTENAANLLQQLKDAGYSADNQAELEKFVAGLNINIPEAGFYRIKGKTSGKYLAAGLASNNKFNMSDAEDATTIFCFDGTKLINYSDGMVNGMNSSTWAWVYGNGDVSTVTFEDGETKGGYRIKSTNAYFFDGGTTADRGGSYDDRAQYHSWYLEAVTELPVTLNGYDCKDGQVRWIATFAAPVAVSSVEGAEIYKTTEKDGYVEAEPANVTGIPAETAVLLVSEEDPGAPVMVFLGETSDAVTTALQPQYACEKGKEGLFLGKIEDSVAGFVALDSETETGGFTGFVADDGNGAKELVFESDATCINSIENGADNGAVFNLQGQRVNKAQKGVYIQNGKKVVLK